MDVINRQGCEPFVTKDGSTIRELLSHRNSGIRKQSLAEATLPPGVLTERHHHPQTEEIYYILVGTGRMEIDGQIREVGPGDAVAIPPGCSHCIQNTGSARSSLANPTRKSASGSLTKHARYPPSQVFHQARFGTLGCLNQGPSIRVAAARQTTKPTSHTKPQGAAMSTGPGPHKHP